MASHLILYATRDGQTQRIAECISQQLQEGGLSVELVNLNDGVEVDLTRYDSVLIGAPIRYGHHLKVVRRFIDRNLLQLSHMPCGFFSINLTARKPEKQDPDTNRYMQKFLSKSLWKPGYLGVLAGSLQYSRYAWYDRLMIQLIMKITGGSTDSSVDVEYTNWERVKGFAQGYGEYLQSACESGEAEKVTE
ncbi:menaquinone-dependent protoporphyrinogen IX dehydrogenase [Parendozoicomonas haliclonae]|uniref:Protoporphyrinogen IX dehydrogenase [quinone] n=1 Tax=Parendozoicomonas haliclonae TaxID=1960125 RepID=A0A1X7AQU3_9GAMM|nr:menaquinone-dependent protoporphyrinogen IX dehydrogenase [Parendozoicomonas haliclonae]SMA50605.1 Protoporphyrinogen IX dehydrogenase [menaquinone] [Parendozoicomonas haliclonae]